MSRHLSKQTGGGGGRGGVAACMGVCGGDKQRGDNSKSTTIPEVLPEQDITLQQGQSNLALRLYGYEGLPAAPAHCIHISK